MTKKATPPLRLYPENEMNLVPLLSAVYVAREMKSAAEDMEKEPLEQLKPQLDSLMSINPVADNNIQINCYGIKRSPGKTTRIDADMLLARGVDPVVIRDCTKETPYYKYSITIVEGYAASPDSKAPSFNALQSGL